MPRQLVVTGFKIYFTPARGTFQCSLALLFTIGLSGVFLEGGPPMFTPGFTGLAT